MVAVMYKGEGVDKSGQEAATDLVHDDFVAPSSAYARVKQQVEEGSRCATCWDIFPGKCSPRECSISSRLLAAGLE